MTEKKRGGARPGSGNKAKDGANASNSDRVCVVIFKRQRARFKALGGSAWLRGAIDNAELKGRSGEAA